MVITSDGGYRRGAPSALKPAVDAAVTAEDSPVEKVLVVQNGTPVEFGQPLFRIEPV